MRSAKAAHNHDVRHDNICLQTTPQENTIVIFCYNLFHKGITNKTYFILVERFRENGNTQILSYFNQ